MLCKRNHTARAHSVWLLLVSIAFWDSSIWSCVLSVIDFFSLLKRLALNLCLVTVKKADPFAFLMELGHCFFFIPSCLMLSMHKGSCRHLELKGLGDHWIQFLSQSLASWPGRPSLLTRLLPLGTHVSGNLRAWEVRGPVRRHPRHLIILGLKEG